MIVVSDASPVTALLTVGQAELLRQLFGEVVIPPAVKAEIERTHQDFPQWLQVRQLRDRAQALVYQRIVDRGEAEAIALAQELKANWLLIDERKGRRLAKEAGVPVLGLVGVILTAKRGRLIRSARELLNQLERDAGIYLTEDVKEVALKSVGE
jgi:predicted nucleic acid-binding protein